jgi:hypothetical protein
MSIGRAPLWWTDWLSRPSTTIERYAYVEMEKISASFNCAQVCPIDYVR